jgi:hypothetical protein
MVGHYSTAGPGGVGEYAAALGLKPPPATCGRRVVSGALLLAVASLIREGRGTPEETAPPTSEARAPRPRFLVRCRLPQVLTESHARAAKGGAHLAGHAFRMSRTSSWSHLAAPATHRAPHFGQTYVIKLPTVCSTTPSVPHFGHLFVGWVGAGTWMGMAVHSTRPRAWASRGTAGPRRASTGSKRVFDRPMGRPSRFRLRPAASREGGLISGKAADARLGDSARCPHLMSSRATSRSAAAAPVGYPQVPSQSCACPASGL